MGKNGGQDLISLLKDPALRVQTAQTGHDLLKKEYNLDTLYPKLEDIYQSVILQCNLKPVPRDPRLDVPPRHGGAGEGFQIQRFHHER